MTTRGGAGVVIPEIQLEIPRNPEHGDFSTNIALVLAKTLKISPRELAEAIVAELGDDAAIATCECAGPGFINLRVATSAFMAVVGTVLDAGADYGRSRRGAGRRVQIEFVSANPTGPLHVGHGRGAAYGAVLANILDAAGYTVEREYYVNDAGRQMDILAVSVWLRYLESAGAPVEMPGNAYQGSYIIDIAARLRARDGARFERSGVVLADPDAATDDAEAALDAVIERAKAVLGIPDYAHVHRFARDDILAGIRDDLAAFGVEFDRWFYESTLAEADAIERVVAALKHRGEVYEKDGATWFRSTAFGDEKDRVVVRENGTPTYFASDIAYHEEKYSRGFDHLINIWGADHHGYIARVKAAIAAMDLPPERLEILLVQFAALYRDGEKVAMSTRSGEFVTLAELVAEVGRDAARFFYSTRRSDQHLDFDLDLAKSTKNENPVYYVQYAHARICNVFVQLVEKGFDADIARGRARLDVLVEPAEKQLAVHLLRYPEMLDHAVENREPHLMTTFLGELAADFHGYYNGTRILVDDEALRNARLALVSAVRQVFANGLALLGVSAPESM